MQKPHQAYACRHALPADLFQDRDAVLAAETFCADERNFFSIGIHALRLYVYDGATLHEHEHTVVQRRSDHLLDRPDLRADHGTDVSQGCLNRAAQEFYLLRATYRHWLVVWSVSTGIPLTNYPVSLKCG